MNRDIQDMINKINRIPIFDIGREAGLITEHSYSKEFRTTSGTKSQQYTHDMIRWNRFNNYVNMTS